jgi:hypothetical protein
MSNYGVSPHIKYEGDGKVWFKKSVRPVETYGANEYNRSPPANFNPSKTRAESRQERAIIKQVMGEAIKDQQAAAILKKMLNEKTAVETLKNISKSTKGGRRSLIRRTIHKRKINRRATFCAKLKK